MMSFSRAFAFGIVPCLAASAVFAADVDVYLINGQSNAGNFAESSGTGATNVGYNLDFARVYDRPDYLIGPAETSGAFSSSSLNANTATTILANQLHASNDLAVFSYIRNGATISNTNPQTYTNGDPYSWYPGDDPASGQKFDDSLYGGFKAWTDARLQGIIDRGDTPVIKGLFWFQGEGDASKGTHGEYQDNLENLIYRFREDYGSNLTVVATKIRVVGSATYQSNAQDINAAMEAVGTADSLFSVVDIADLDPVSANDVHLNTNGLRDLAPRWSAEMLVLQQNVPEPGSLALLGSAGLLLLRRRR